MSRCARRTPHRTAGRTGLAIVKIDQSEASPKNFAGWLLIGSEVILVSKGCGRHKIENGCFFGLVKFVLDNFKEKESLALKEPILVRDKFLILPMSS